MQKEQSLEAPLTLLTKDENLSIAIKDVTKQKDPEKANAELEKILKETKKEKAWKP